MVLIKEIELELTKNKSDPEAIEDTLIKDSVIDLANADFSKIDDFDDIALGEIRRKIIVDPGYSGKPISRKHFSRNDLHGDKYARKGINSDDKTTFENDNSYESSEDDSKEMFDNKTDKFSVDSDNDSNQSEQSEGSSIKRSSEDEYSQDEHDESDDEDTEDDFGVDLADYEEKNDQAEDDINIFSEKTRDSDAEVAKGISVKNQLNIWESLLEGRIKLQSSLIAANKLYQTENFTKFKSELTPKDETVLTNAYSSLGNLMKILLEMQEVSLKSSPEYLNMSKISELKSKDKNEDSDDESISSSLASGNEEENNDNIVNKSNKSLGEPKCKKKKIGNYSDHLEEIYTDFKPFKDKTIQTWNDKTRITSGKVSSSDFSAFDQPTIKQIEQILLDKDRLIKRTQLKRSDYNILGKPQIENQPEDDGDDKRETIQKEYDKEIFDDDDFYHKLLRDFIERKSSDVTDSKKHGRQWLEIQQLRSRMKRKVDTRCTKGRKLRFTVHNKLVNFMAPIPCNNWTEEAQTQLFKSLFGKANEQLS